MLRKHQNKKFERRDSYTIIYFITFGSSISLNLRKHCFSLIFNLTSSESFSWKPLLECNSEFVSGWVVWKTFCNIPQRYKSKFLFLLHKIYAVERIHIKYKLGIPSALQHTYQQDKIRRQYFLSVYSFVWTSTVPLDIRKNNHPLFRRVDILLL